RRHVRCGNSFTGFLADACPCFHPWRSIAQSTSAGAVAQSSIDPFVAEYADAGEGRIPRAAHSCPRYIQVSQIWQFGEIFDGSIAYMCSLKKQRSQLFHLRQIRHAGIRQCRFAQVQRLYAIQATEIASARFREPAAAEAQVAQMPQRREIQETLVTDGVWRP